MNQDERTDSRPPRASRPRRGRWVLWVLPAVPLVALILAVLFGPYLALRIAAVREGALDSAVVRRALGERLRVRIATVNRLELRGADLGGVQVEARDSTGVWHAVGEIGRLKVRWSPLRQLSGETLIHTLEAGPITLRREALPLLFGGPRQPGAQDRAGPFDLRFDALLPPGLPRILVRHIMLGPIEVHEGDQIVLRAGLERGELTTDATALSVRPQDAWVELPLRGLQVRVSDAQIRVTRDEAQVERLAFCGTTAEGELSAQYDPRAGGSPLRGDLTLVRLDPGILTRWFIPALTPRPTDTVSGVVGFRLGEGPAEIEFALQGVLLGEGCSECSGLVRIAGQEVAFEGVELQAAACELSAQGRWDGDARRLTFDARWSRFDRTSAWLPWIRELPLEGSFPGQAQLEIEVPAQGAVVIAGSADLRYARPLGIRLDRVRWTGRVAVDDVVTADELLVDLGTGRVRAAGRYPWRSGEVEGSVTVDSVALSALPSEWTQGAAGRLWGQVQVSGLPNDPLLEGSLRLADLRYDAWSAQQASVASLLLWPRDLRGSGTVDLRGVRRGEGPPADLDGGFSRWQEWISLWANLRRADVDLHVEGRVDPGGQAQIEAGSATLLRLGRWELAAPCGVTWGGGVVAVDSLRLTSAGTDLVAAGRWVPGRQDLALGARLEAFGLERLREILAVPGFDLSGSARVRLDAAGRWPDPRLEFEVRAEDLAAGGLALGQAELLGVWSDSALALSRGRVAGPTLQAQLTTLKARPGAPLMGLLGSDEADPLGLLRRTAWESHVEVEHLDLAAWAPLLGMPRGQAADATRGSAILRTIGGRAVPVHVNAPWEAAPVAAQVGGLGGGWQGTLELSGTLAQPRVHLAGASEDLAWGGVPMGTLAIDTRYENSLVSVDDLVLRDGDKVSRISGYYPLHIELLPFQAVRTDWPAHIQATLANLNIGLVSGLIPYVADVHGELSGALAVGGTGTEPELAGSLYLRGGGFRIPGRSERIFDVAAEMQLETGGLRVVSLAGRSGPRGTMHAEGLIRGLDEFDLLARAEQVRVFEQGIYSFEARAESLRVYSRRDEKPAPIPRIRGHVTVLSGYLRPQIEAGAGAAAAGRGEPIPWEIAIDVAVPGAVQVSQSTIRADVGEGDLRLTFRWPYWSASGSLRILDGSYRLLNNNFAVLDGTLDLRDTGAGLDARVDVTGETYVAVADAETQGEPVRVEVHVSGRPEELRIDLTSEPAYSEEQIAELLTYRRLTGTGRLGAETQGVLVNEMVARLEASLAEQMPPSTTVNIETSGAPGEAWRPRRVRLQQMITPELTGDYTQEFYQGTDWEFYVQYRLSRRLSLRTGMARERDATLGSIEEYSADLKWWFEYE